MIMMMDDDDNDNDNIDKPFKRRSSNIFALLIVLTISKIAYDLHWCVPHEATSIINIRNLLLLFNQ